MKTSNDYYSELFNFRNSKMEYALYIDLDGCLVDFSKGIQERIQNTYEKVQKNKATEFEKKHIQKALDKGLDPYAKDISNKVFRNVSFALIMNDIDFWAKLDWMPDGKTLWNFVKGHNPSILSSPGNSGVDAAEKGKKIWIKNNLNPPPKEIILEATKSKHAAKNHILIDDKDKNTGPWISAGGEGILHTAAASTIQVLKSKYGF